MTRESIIFLLGILLFFVPQLGIPADWKQYFYIGTSAILVIIGYTLRRREFLRRTAQANGEQANDSFAESNPSLTSTSDSQSDL